MMRTTLKERVRKRLLRFGKKNRICGILVLPVLFVTMFLFHAAAYLCNNRKRFGMAATITCLFAVYCSFSFPLFIGSGTAETMWEIPDSEAEIELLAEAELTPEDLELLADEDVLEDYELQDADNPYGMDMIVKYNAEEILAAVGEEVEDSSRTEQNTDIQSEETVFSKDDWRLVLINKQHSIPEDYEFNLGTIAGGMQCDERILGDLFAMLKAAKEDGVTLTICSPYRSTDRQVMLFDRKIKRYMNRGMSYMEAYQLASQAVTIPGNSEHEIGLALDIVCDTYTSLNEGFGDTEAGKWLAENSRKYGFILRYPKGKEYVTGIEYEPWHFRYVGTEAATIIMDEGITLEEFWEGL